MTRWPVAAVLALAAAACGGKKATCEAAIDKLIELATAERKDEGAKLSGMRVELIEACHGKKHAQPQMDCAVAAKSLADYGGCFDVAGVKKAMTAEAQVELNKIRDSSRTYFGDGTNPYVGPPLPKLVEAKRGKCGPTKFDRDGGATAVGDLDCDDTSTTYELVDVRADGGVTGPPRYKDKELE